MVDLSFESYLDPDYNKEIIFDFSPKFGGVGEIPNIGILV